MAKRRRLQLAGSVIESAKFLNSLSKIKSRSKEIRFINQATPNQLFSLVETAFNIVKSRVPLHYRQRPLLVDRATQIRRLSRVRSARSARRVIQGQSKGQVGAGLPIVPISALLARVIVPYLAEYLLKG